MPDQPRTTSTNNHARIAAIERMAALTRQLLEQHATNAGGVPAVPPAAPSPKKPARRRPTSRSPRCGETMPPGDPAPANQRQRSS